MAEAKGLTRKVGPLPLWAWGLILGVAGYFLYERYKASSSAAATTGGSTSPTASVLDPNAIDPNTGLTYGQEEAAALNSNAAGSALNGTSPAESAAAGNVQTATNELGDLSSFLTGFQTVAQQLGYTQPPVPSTNQSSSTTAAANSPAMTQASTPTVAPTVHPQKIATGVKSSASAGALAQLTNLLNTGYRKVSGTTQKHAGKGNPLPQTGTYVRKGSPTYYVYGSTVTGYHIRRA